jgi:hypothetical protein
MPVMRMLRQLGEIDDDLAAQADLHRLVSRLDRLVEQKHVLRRGLEQARDHSPVIEHVAVHQQHLLARRKALALHSERDDASFAITRILDEDDAVDCAEAMQFSADEL